jgi:glycosyltransferase involved in cell wall biosynthesis
VVDAPAARAAGAATVTTVHGFTGGGLRNRLYEWLQRRAIRKCDAVVAVARSLMRNLLRDGAPAERMHLVVNAWRPTAIPLDRNVARHLLGAEPAEFTIGWVGRLSEEKGLDVALRALPALAGVPARLHVIGAGRERCALRAVAEELGVGDRVVWHGAIQNAERLYRAFDAFALSSRTEGSPIVLFEAMSARVPIAATCVGGVPGMVSEREALLVPANDPEALGAALLEICQAPGAALRRANAAHRRLAAEYREGAWVDRYRIVYDAAVTAAAMRS